MNSVFEITRQCQEPFAASGASLAEHNSGDDELLRFISTAAVGDGRNFGGGAAPITSVRRTA